MQKDRIPQLSAHNHWTKELQDKNKKTKPFEDKFWDKTKK